jgi:hypothetical protein
MNYNSYCHSFNIRENRLFEANETLKSIYIPISHFFLSFFLSVFLSCFRSFFLSLFIFSLLLSVLVLTSFYLLIMGVEVIVAVDDTQ